MEKGKEVKAWAVVSSRGTLYTPAMYGYTYSVFTTKTKAQEFLDELVHPERKAKIILCTITLHRASNSPLLE